MTTYDSKSDESEATGFANALDDSRSIPVAPMIDLDKTAPAAEPVEQTEEAIAPAHVEPKSNGPIIADADVEIHFDGDYEEESEPELVEEPVVEEPAPEEPAPVDEPVVEEPATVEEPVAEEPAEEPAPEEPVVEESIPDEPIEEPIEEEILVEETVEEEPIEEPAEEPAPEEPVEAPVDPAEDIIDDGLIHTDAIHADEMMTDEEAEEHIEVIEEEPGRERSGKMHIINLDTLCENFAYGETVTLEALQAKKLAPKNAGRVKILARGIMTKKLDIIADGFSLQAVKMITLAGGRAEQFK